MYIYTCYVHATYCWCGMYKGWLCVVEDMMHKSLKEVLRACRLDLKKHLSKREKWVREWPGQVSNAPRSFLNV